MPRPALHPECDLTMRQRDAGWTLLANANSSGGQLPVPPALGRLSPPQHIQTYSACIILQAHYSHSEEKCKGTG